MLSENQVFVITAAFFAVIAGAGILLALLSRKAGEERPASVSTEEQMKQRLKQFDEELQARLRDVDAHVAQAHATIDRQVATVR